METARLAQGREAGVKRPFGGTRSGGRNARPGRLPSAQLETCAVRIRRFVVVEDCGRIINPLIVEGQAIGGVAQGIGAALLEEVVYDANGQLLSGTLMDYLVPTASEVPVIEVHHLERPSPTTLGGFKGMGEGGTIGAPAAVANAIADALAPLGVEITELPLTPERLFRLIHRR